MPPFIPANPVRATHIIQTGTNILKFNELTILALSL